MSLYLKELEQLLVGLQFFDKYEGIRKESSWHSFWSKGSDFLRTFEIWRFWICSPSFQRPCGFWTVCFLPGVLHFHIARIERNLLVDSWGPSQSAVINGLFLSASAMGYLPLYGGSAERRKGVDVSGIPGSSGAERESVALVLTCPGPVFSSMSGLWGKCFVSRCKALSTETCFHFHLWPC